jgi:cytochrome c peroxidase
VRLGLLVAIGCVTLTWPIAAQRPGSRIGRELAVTRHLRDDEEFRLSGAELVEFGRKLFEANWTEQDGGGRPLSKGSGSAVSDPSRPLKGARAFNRISGPDANSCQGCHNAPHGITGGNGDFVTHVFDRAERFDFVTFDPADAKSAKARTEAQDEAAGLQAITTARATPGLFGAGYVEMLARQITAELQRIRDSIQPGQSKALVSKGISFGSLARRRDGVWDVSGVDGLPEASVRVTAAVRTPNLIVRPWLRDGRAVSIREVTNELLNWHHGIQSTERFGRGTDPDGDGVVDEMTRADVTALAIFQATLPVPGRVIPADTAVERAVLTGERLFDELRCSTCHRPSLALERKGWVYSEPSPYNPPGNLRTKGARTLSVDLNDPALPAPRLSPSPGAPDAVQLQVYTDFKLHDIGDVAAAGARGGSGARFLTRRLWGAGNQPPYFHHGLFTTLRQAVVAHGGEALESRLSFQRLSSDDQSAVIEFLKSLQVLPPDTMDLVVDEHHRARSWPPKPGF